MHVAHEGREREVSIKVRDREDHPHLELVDQLVEDVRGLLVPFSSLHPRKNINGGRPQTKSTRFHHEEIPINSGPGAVQTTPMQYHP